VGSEYTIARAEGWSQIEQLVRTMAVDVIVLDPRISGTVAVEPVRRLRDRYPSVPVAIYTRFEADLAPALLEWGDAGVCGAAFLDISDDEWGLRRLVNASATRSAGEGLFRTLEKELPGLDEEVRRALRLGLHEAATIQTVKEWADRAGLPRRHLYRLFRDAGLPTPKTCLQWLRLLYAARALADPGVSVEDVVFRMRYSAPANFWNHVRGVLGLTPSQLRWSVTPEELADRFAAQCRDRARGAAGRSSTKG
jgi:AraC-like DNA-binding protein